ncbi:hypothetical protein E1218_31585 [Kribbella turkmenica]|uniref:Uncharacterized protein n=1 Tax=Kribbella turkmenica TaxID=2530375 RepID=A0A4R4WN78_9ACTN|nr:hypothetical protein [Kribbella turkmenica]TDD15380.1 hypothetical protein E1218_31585 [Kribbella turkmenica]
MTQYIDPPTPEGPAPDEQPKGDGRPGNLALAGAGSVLAVLAFLGGTAVGHAWDGPATQQDQFGGQGGGRQFPGQQGQQGQAPGQQGQVPGQQGQAPGQGGTGQDDTGQTQAG